MREIFSSIGELVVASEYVQIVILAAFFAFLLWISSRLIRLLDDKVPELKLQEGRIRYLIEGPRFLLNFAAIFVIVGVFVLNTDASRDSIGVKLFGVVITEFGFAFFIAFILHNTIEMHSAVERDRQLSRGMLAYLYGVNLDDEMFHAAEEHIFKPAFYRRNMRVEYEFVSKRGGRVFLKYSIEYVVENISNKDRKFDISTFVERSDLPCELEGEAFPNPLGLHRISINGLSLEDGEIERARNVDQNDPKFIRSSHQIEIRSGEKIGIKTVSFLEKCDRDTEFWRSVHPADGVEVRFVWRPELNLDVKVDAIHPDGEFDRLPHTEDGLVEAKLSRPLFPYNGFLFWWSDKEVGEREG